MRHDLAKALPAAPNIPGTEARCREAPGRPRTGAATIHIRRAKNGTPGIHGLQGDELRLTQVLGGAGADHEIEGAAQRVRYRVAVQIETDRGPVDVDCPVLEPQRRPD
jgi:hypothetical protein